MFIIHQKDMQIYIWDLFRVFERDWEEEDSLACQSETGSDYCDPELGHNPICRPETFRKEDRSQLAWHIHNALLSLSNQEAEEVLVGLNSGRSFSGRSEYEKNVNFPLAVQRVFV